MENTKSLSGLETKNFEKTVDGKKVSLYILRNASGAEVTVTNFGGKIASILVPDNKGNWVDVVLGKSNIDDYMNDQEPYFGAICGRTGNRIANGKFTLDGVDYQLAINNGPSNLHGGVKAFNSVVWTAKQIDKQTLELFYLSKDGEEGFPGNLSVTIIYKLTDDNTVDIEYKATTDKATIINLTNHSYFNLSGEGDPNIGDHTLQINAKTYLPTSDIAIPFGDPENVEGTPFDFQSPHTIGERIEDENTQLKYGRGYDHTFIIDKAYNELGFVSKAYSPKTGIILETYSTEPGVQLYTSNWLDGSFIGKNGHTYPQRSAFCLETQHYPDSINHPDYPSTVLRPGEEFKSKTQYKFSNKD